MLVKAEVKALVKEAGKRSSPEFMSALEYAIRQKVRACLEMHNGGKKTLTADVVHFVFNGSKKP